MAQSIQINVVTGEQTLVDYTPDPVPDQAVPPIIVSPRQIRQALTAVGLRAGVESAVAAGTQDLKDWWEFATAFEENHPMVVAMGQQLGQTSEQIHQLFQLASSL